MNTTIKAFEFALATAVICLMLAFHQDGKAQTVSFTTSALAGETVYNPTSLQFGPDGRLYVSQQNGLIHVYTIARSGPNNYTVTNTEVINLIQQIPNHNDDGALNSTVNTRQVTGLIVKGTAANPVVYVSSSDPRIGGGTLGPGNDKFLDTNSGIISKLTKNGSSWQRLDLVRGLPRSEENHSTNGMQLDEVNNILYVAQGGNTNMGAPSFELVYTPEYALSAAILKINLNAIGNATYDLPTLDDEDKANTGSISGHLDNTDPFGGNNGKNQAIIDPLGPVQVYSPGWRNNYDVLITKAGKMYSFDNGPNNGWGGTPVGCSNDTSEPGLFYCDYLHFIPSQGYYAGHPNPTRGNRNNKFNLTNPQSPVPAASENPVECNYLIPGSEPNSITGICASTNGMAEYVASNFSNAMKGNLLAASFNGKIYRFKMTAAGDTLVAGGQTILASGFGTTPLDVTAQGDLDVFPGTIWAVTYGSHGITVLEPGDYATGTLTQFFADRDGDIYGNLLDTAWAATQPSGFVTNHADCDDTKANIYPGATEIADGKDNNCNGFVDENLGVATRVRINCGGSQYIAADGDTFSADIYYLSGTANVSSTNPSIANSDDDLLYKSERYGNFSYNIGIPNGNYSVSLHFAEIWSGGQTAGARTFHVDMEGTRVLNNYDIYADAGGYTAAVKTFSSSVSNGVLNIVFTKVVNNAKVSAIEITPVQNTAPTFAISGNVSVSEDFAAAQYVNVTPDPVPPSESGQTVTYSLSPSSVSFANVSINTSTGNVTVNPVQNANGSQLFTITANDGQSVNNTASKTFTLTVSPVNDAPVFSLSGSITASEDFSGTRTVSTTPGSVPADELSQAVTYSLQPSSVSFANVSINSSTGNVTISSVSNGNGSQLFTVVANDGQASNNSSSQTFTLTVNALNDAPNFTLSGDITDYEDFIGTKTVSVTPISVPSDELAQTVTYSLQPASVSFANVSINTSTGNVTISKVVNGNGSQLFTVVANDGQSSNNTSSQTFTLTVNAINDAPAFTLSGSINVSEDFSGTRVVYATPSAIPTDEQSQIVSYSLSPASVNFAGVIMDPLTGNVTISKVSNGVGSQLFTVTASDGQSSGNTYSQTFMLTVTTVNDAPIFTLSGNITADEDFTGMRTVIATISPVPEDEISQPVRYSLTPATVSFANVLIDTLTGEVRVTSKPNASGSQLFTVTANDNQSQNNLHSATFQLLLNSINDAPAFSLSGNVNETENFAGTKTVSVTPAAVPSNEAGQTVTYSLTPASVSFANVSFSTLSGQVSFTSIPNASGSQSFTVTANDAQSVNNTFSQLFDLSVSSVNGAPTLTPLTDLFLNEDAPVQVISLSGITDGDDGLQTLTVSASSGNTALVPNPVVNYNSPNSIGTLTLQITPDMDGIAIITVTVNDGSVNSSITRNLIVTVNAVNDPPYFDAIQDPIVVMEDAAMQQIQITGITAGTNEPQNLVFTAVSNNTSLIPNPVVSYANGSSTTSLSFAPAANNSGMATVTITVNDGASANNTFTRYLIISVNPVNDPPALNALNDVMINEDAGLQTVQLAGISSGPNESQILTITAVSNNPALIPNPAVNYSNPSNAGSLSFQPAAEKSGLATITVTVDDGQSQNNTITRYLLVSVNAVNDAPVFTLSGDIQQERNFSATELVTVTPGYVPQDEASQVITYSLQPASVDFANVVIDANSGTVTITSVPDSFGSQLFTVIATDGQLQNNVASATFNLMVGEGNYAPIFSLSGDVIESEDFSGTRLVTVTPDPVHPGEGSQTVGYSISPASVSFANVSFNAGTGAITVSAKPNASGSQLFTVTANDGQPSNNIAIRTFMLTVQSVNDAPAFTHSGDIIETEDFTSPRRVQVFPSTVPADELSQAVHYSLSPSSVAFAEIDFNSTNGMVMIHSIADANGMAVFTITADDGQAEHNLATGSFILAVNAKNDAPAFTLSGDLLLDEDFSGTAIVTLTSNHISADELNQQITYTLSPASVAFANVSLNPSTGRVEVLPVQDASGMAVFTITANDGQSENAIATGSFILNVNAVNDPPVFTLSGDLSADESFANILSVAVTPHAPANESSETIVYSLNPGSVGFANIQFNTATGLVEITSIPNAFGTRVFTITANDGKADHNIYSQSFTLTVHETNMAPVFSMSGDVMVNEDFSTTEKVYVSPDPLKVEPGETVTYSIAPSQVSFADVHINTVTGEVTIHSAANASGQQLFTVIANDGNSFNNLHSESFMLAVNPVNDAPTLNAITKPSPVLEDATTKAIALTGISAGPGESQPVTVTAYSLNTVLAPDPVIQYNSPDASGTMFFTPNPNQYGTATITVVVSDGQLSNNEVSRTFTIEILPVNDYPTVDGITDLVQEEDAPSQVVAISGISAGPNENQALSITAITDNALLIENLNVHYTNGASAQLTFDLGANEFGFAEITILVDDGQAANNLTSRSFSIQVNAVNDAPAFQPIADLLLNEDFGTAHIPVIPVFIAANEQQQTVHYTLQPASVPFMNISFDSNTGEMDFTSIGNTSGEQVFTITANDGQAVNNLFVQSFNVKVNAVNDTPDFQTSGDVSLNEDFNGMDMVQIIPGAVPSDETDQVVVYSLNPSSVGFANILFNSSTGQVTISAVPNGNGVQFFTVVADDGQSNNNIATSTFTLSISAVNDAPVFQVSNDVSIVEDFTNTAIVNVIPGLVPADELTQVITYSISPASVDFAYIQFDASTGQVLISAIPDGNGSRLFTITANDGQSLNKTASATFMLSVQPANDSPAFTHSGDIITTEDFAGTKTVHVTPLKSPADEVAQPVIYSLVPPSVNFASILFDSNTGLVTISPIANANGDQLFTVTADDGQSSNNISSGTFTLRIQAVNDAPTFHMSNDVHLNEDFPITPMVDVIADTVPADEAASTVTYSLNPPSVDFANIQFDSLTGQVMISAVPNGNGDMLFTVTANDGQATNNIATANFMLMIHPRNDEPLFTLSGDITVDQDFTGTEMVMVTPMPVPQDELSQVVQYSLNPSSVSFATVAIDPITGEVTIRSLPAKSGSQMFAVIANDGEVNNSTASDTFTLTVNAAIELPKISLSGDVAIDEDFTTTEVVTILANAASPISYPVEVKNNVFIPKDVYVFQGDIVEWTNVEGWHNVNADTAVFPGNPEGFGNAVDGPGWVYSQQFNIPGIYDYQCDPHAAMGMVGTVNVLPNRPPIKHHVNVFTMAFSPKDLVILQGDTIEWTNTQGYHNVNFDTLTYPDNPIGFGNDVGGPGWTFSWVFDVSGFYNYQCDPHAYFGQLGTVRVVERSGKIVGDTTLPVIYRLNPPTSAIANLRIDSVTGAVLITSLPDANGVQQFEVIADYGIGTKSDVFKLIVNPVDDKPKQFTLLYPYNNSLVSKDDKLLLKWDAAPEVDGDAVTYALSINGHFDHMTIMNIADTFMSIDASKYLKNDTLYEWWVTATDGISDVECSKHFHFKMPVATGLSSIDATDAVSIISYPNPFDEMINFQYRLPENYRVRMEIINMLGQSVNLMADEEQTQGVHQMQWNGTDQQGNPVTSGMYFYRFEAMDHENKVMEKTGSLTKF